MPELTTTCGECGTLSGTVECNTAIGQWKEVEWDDCVGSSETQVCGNCGTQTCKADGSDWDTCSGQGVCTPGDTDNVSNGTNTCSEECTWNTPICNEGYVLEDGECKAAKTPCPETCPEEWQKRTSNNYQEDGECCADIVCNIIGSGEEIYNSEDSCDGNDKEQYNYEFDLSYRKTCYDVYISSYGFDDDYIGASGWEDCSADISAPELPCENPDDIGNNITYHHSVKSKEFLRESASLYTAGLSTTLEASTDGRTCPLIRDSTCNIPCIAYHSAADQNSTYYYGGVNIAGVVATASLDTQYKIAKCPSDITAFCENNPSGQCAIANDPFTSQCRSSGKLCCGTVDFVQCDNRCQYYINKKTCKVDKYYYRSIKCE
jgi:hypothetical protein